MKLTFPVELCTLAIMSLECIHWSYRLFRTRFFTYSFNKIYQTSASTLWMQDTKLSRIQRVLALMIIIRLVNNYDNNRSRAVTEIYINYGENQLSHGCHRGSRIDIWAGLKWKTGGTYFKHSKYSCKVQGMKGILITEEQVVWFTQPYTAGCVLHEFIS